MGRTRFCSPNFLWLRRSAHAGPRSRKGGCCVLFCWKRRRLGARDDDGDAYCDIPCSVIRDCGFSAGFRRASDDRLHAVGLPCDPFGKLCTDRSDWRCHAVAGCKVDLLAGNHGTTHGHYRHHDSHHEHDGHTGCAACNAASTQKGSGWIAAAVGVVPCTGALLVMLFGLANDLVWPAIAMVSMSAIGITALWGRGWAERRFGSNPAVRMRFETGARLAGASCVLIIGVLLFWVTFSNENSLTIRETTLAGNATTKAESGG